MAAGNYFIVAGNLPFPHWNPLWLTQTNNFELPVDNLVFTGGLGQGFGSGPFLRQDVQINKLVLVKQTGSVQAQVGALNNLV